MPGVNLDFLPASEAPEALGSPDSVCAESGLEEVIGDLLAQEDAEDEEQPFGVQKFELTLRCAVGEIHSDLQAFGKRVDARLGEAEAQVAPLAEALAKLQEENLWLKIQQEKMVRQVEALCRAMGLPDPQLYELPSKEDPHETKTLSGDPPSCTHQEATLEASDDLSSCTTQNSPSVTHQDSPDITPTHSDSSVSLETPSSLQQPQSTESSTPQMSEPSLVPHPPTFATRRSLSAPSLMANISFNDSMVPLSFIYNSILFNSNKLIKYVFYICVIGNVRGSAGRECCLPCLRYSLV